MTGKKKCIICNKKVLIFFKCRCNNHYCIKHQSPENHNCSYDYKKHKNVMETIENKKVSVI